MAKSSSSFNTEGRWERMAAPALPAALRSLNLGTTTKNFLCDSGSPMSCLCLPPPPAGHGLNDLGSSPGGLQLPPLTFLSQMTARQAPSHQAPSRNLSPALISLRFLCYLLGLFVLFVKIKLSSPFISCPPHCPAKAVPIFAGVFKYRRNTKQ